MKKKIFKGFLLFFFAFVSFYPSVGQYLYTDHDASFTILEDDKRYRVNCRVDEDIGGTAKFQRLKSRLRLRSIDLIGNYIILNNLELPFEDRGMLLQAFVDNTSLHFTANIDHVQSNSWKSCENERCISFYCNKEDFRVNPAYLEQEFDISGILYRDLRMNKSISSACSYMQMFELDIRENIRMELLFLSGNGFLDPAIDKLLKIHPYYRLENSLFENDSLQNQIVNRISGKQPADCSFENMLVSRILFTSSPAKDKLAFFDTYKSELSGINGMWYDLLQFATSFSLPADINELTVFDIIGNYPMAANIYGLRLGDNGAFYDSAVEEFASENPSEALEHLKDQINYSGINAINLNLSGACYRLLAEYEKALGYLLMAYYLDDETPYIKGNLMICLKQLNYPSFNELSEYFLRQNSIDPWSRNQIENLKTN